jgi:hypothetical protein
VLYGRLGWECQGVTHVLLKHSHMLVPLLVPSAITPDAAISASSKLTLFKLVRSCKVLGVSSVKGTQGPGSPEQPNPQHQQRGVEQALGSSSS